MSKFKVGDRVRNIEEGLLTIPYGLTGTVLEEDDVPYVEWDAKVKNGHNAHGRGKYGYCKAQGGSSLELLEDEKELGQLLKITFKGQEITISELKQLLKEVEDLKE